MHCMPCKHTAGNIKILYMTVNCLHHLHSIKSSQTPTVHPTTMWSGILQLPKFILVPCSTPPPSLYPIPTTHAYPICIAHSYLLKPQVGPLPVQLRPPPHHVLTLPAITTSPTPPQTPLVLLPSPPSSQPLLSPCVPRFVRQRSLARTTVPSPPLRAATPGTDKPWASNFPYSVLCR